MINQIKKQFRILAIETSCDETSAAVLEVTNNKQQVANLEILSNIVSSQVKLHAKYGGVYPELASREHVKNIIPVIEQALSCCHADSKKNIVKEASKSNLDEIPASPVGGLREVCPEYFRRAQDDMQNIDYIAVTTSPGLIGSLLVGTETAKTLAYVFDKPVVLVNHLEGHIYANFINKICFISNLKSQISKINSKFGISKPKQNTIPKFPLMALIVSGGHTSLVYMKNHLNYKIIGETLDDAAGEAYDKVATMLGLGYPGGPVIDKYASEYLSKNSKHEIPASPAGRRNPKQILNSNSQIFKTISQPTTHNPHLFPRPLINATNHDFSFSGLKTSVLYYLKKYKKSRRFANGKPVEDLRQNKILSGPYSKKIIEKVCYEFQEAVVETLVIKTLKAAKKYKVKSILVSGGVAANTRLRERFLLEVSNQLPNVELFMPEKQLCTDNAAMIGIVAAHKILAGKINNWYDIKAKANSKLENLR